MLIQRVALTGVLAGLISATASQAEAVQIIDPFGFSAFSSIVSHGSKTITVTETIDAANAGFTILFEDHSNDAELGFDDRDFAWQITKIVTNGTGVNWVNFDNEVTVPDGAGGFQSSSDFDLTSFDQGNPSRVITSTTFHTLFLDELADRDFLQFQGGPLGDGAIDTQNFPVTSFIISTAQISQTPNFGVDQEPGTPVIPEPGSLLLFGISLAGLMRRRKTS